MSKKRNAIATTYPFLHIELFPSEKKAGMPIVQDFLAPMRPSYWRCLNPAAQDDASMWINPMSAGQPPNWISLRVTGATANWDPNTTDPPTSPYTVPIMLYDEPAMTRITAYHGTDETYNKGTARKIWVEEFTYAPSAEDFPPAKMASSWKPDATLFIPTAERLHHITSFICSKTPREIAAEQCCMSEKKAFVALKNTGPNYGIILGVQRATQSNGEALTWFMDRVYALTTLVIFLSNDRFTQMMGMPSVVGSEKNNK